MEGHHLHCEVVLTKILLVDMNIIGLLPKCCKNKSDSLQILAYLITVLRCLFPNLVVANTPQICFNLYLNLHLRELFFLDKYLHLLSCINWHWNFFEGSFILAQPFVILSKK